MLKISCDLNLGVINGCNFNCYLDLSQYVGIFISLPMLLDPKISNGCCCDKKQVRVLLLHCLLCISALFIFCMFDPRTAELMWLNYWFAISEQKQ